LKCAEPQSIFISSLERNSDLLVLGELRSQYESNGILYQEYNARFWENSGSLPAVTRFIRIETDIALNKEIQRYLVLTGPTDFFNVAKAVQSRPKEARIRARFVGDIDRRLR
jgi:hypothetical protein